jgi:hypothetical protein
LDIDDLQSIIDVLLRDSAAKDVIIADLLRAKDVIIADLLRDSAAKDVIIADLLRANADLLRANADHKAINDALQSA